MLHFHERGQEFWKQNGAFSLSSAFNHDNLDEFSSFKNKLRAIQKSLNNKTGFANLWGWIHVKLQSVLSWKHTTFRLQDFRIRNKNKNNNNKIVPPHDTALPGDFVTQNGVTQVLVFVKWSWIFIYFSLF